MYYLVHAGKGHDENPPGRGSGRYPYGSGERPFQDIEGTEKRIRAVKNLVDAASKGIPKDKKKKSVSSAKVSAKNLTDEELRKIVSRMNLERQYNTLTTTQVDTGHQKVAKVLETAGTALAITTSALALMKELRK